MTSSRSSNRLVALSCSVYNALLSAYPKRFRADYGREMALIFRDTCASAFDQSGTNGVLGLWGATLGDLLTSVPENHIEEIVAMHNSTRVNLIRLSGLAAILGGLAWIVFASLAGQRAPGVADGAYRNTGDIIPLFLVGFLLLMLGLLGQSIQATGFAPRLLLGLASLVGLAGLVGQIIGSLWLDRLWVLIVMVPLLSHLLFLSAAALILLSQAGPKASTRWVGGLLLVIAVTTFFVNLDDWRIWFAVPAGLSWIAIGYNLWINHTNPVTPPPFSPA